jgi:hypothetical protein
MVVVGREHLLVFGEHGEVLLEMAGHHAGGERRRIPCLANSIGQEFRGFGLVYTYLHLAAI